MKCQNLFPGKNKKKYFKMLSSEFFIQSAYIVALSVRCITLESFLHSPGKYFNQNTLNLIFAETYTCCEKAPNLGICGKIRPRPSCASDQDWPGPSLYANKIFVF